MNDIIQSTAAIEELLSSSTYIVDSVHGATTRAVELVAEQLQSTKDVQLTRFRFSRPFGGIAANIKALGGVGLCGPGE